MCDLTHPGLTNARETACFEKLKLVRLILKLKRFEDILCLETLSDAGNH